MTLDPQKVMQMFYLFSKVLPIYENSQTQKLNSIFGKEFTKLVPDLCLSIGDLGSKNLEILDLYFDFMQQAIDYCRGKREEFPEMDETQDQILPEMNKALEEFMKNAKPINL